MSVSGLNETSTLILLEGSCVQIDHSLLIAVLVPESVKSSPAIVSYCGIQIRFLAGEDGNRNLDGA